MDGSQYRQASFVKSLSFNTLVAALGRMLGVTTTVVTTAIITRTLGTELFGEYSLIIAFLSIFYAAADFGLGQLFVKEISRPSGINPERPGEIVTLRTLLLVSLFSFALFLALFLPYSPLVRQGLLVAASGFFFLSLAHILTGIFQKGLSMHWVALAEWGGRLVQLAGVGGVAWAWSRGWLGGGLPAVLLLFLAAFTVSSGVQLLVLFLRGRRMQDIAPRLNRGRAKALLKEAFPMGASLMFVYVYFHADTLLLAMYHPGSPVGFYNLAYKVLENVIFFPAAYAGLVFPRLVEAWERDQGRFRQLLFSVAWPVAIAAPLVAGAIALAAPLIMRLVGGPAFTPASEALAILSLAALFIYLATVPGQAIVAIGAQRKALWVYAAGAVINVTLNLIFIPRYSFIATSWMTVLTEALVTAGLYLVLWRELRSAKTMSDLTSVLHPVSGGGRE
jgi:O-antigen/teichoic acid export membrane protein